jgi:hypothetical protein
MTEQEQTLFKKLLNLFNADKGKNDSDEEDEMKQEQVDQLAASITTAMAAGFSKLQETVDTKFSKPDDGDEGSGDDQKPPKVTDDENKFSGRLDSIEKSVGELVTGFKELSNKGVGATDIDDDTDDKANGSW